MRKKIISGVLLGCLFLSPCGPAYAGGGEQSLTRGAASLIVPGLGQYLNGDLENQTGKIKTGTMVLLEVGAIITTAVVGGVAGYPQIWAGIGIFIFNHVWSAADAYMGAPAGPEISMTQRTTSER